MAKKRKQKQEVPNVVVHIHTSYNNTIITVTDDKNQEALFWSSAGVLGFKGSKKSTPYAAQLVAQSILQTAKDFKVKTIKIKAKGIGPGKDAAIRQFNSGAIEVVNIEDVTPIPHNGVRKKKSKLQK